MDTGNIATLFAGEMKTHQSKLAGNANEAQVAQTALESAAKAIMERHDEQRKSAQSLLTHWDAKAAEGFEGRSARFGDDLTTTAEASARGAKIVSEVTHALAARHSATGSLVDEFVAKAEGLLKAGFALAGVKVPGALLKALSEVADLAGPYVKESDRVGDPGQAQHKPSPGKGNGKEHGKGHGAKGHGGTQHGSTKPGSARVAFAMTISGSARRDGVSVEVLPGGALRALELAPRSPARRGPGARGNDLDPGAGGRRAGR